MAPSTGKPLLRSSHRKSRHGCMECKARHVKCDETHPSCHNCTSSERTCSFTRAPLATVNARRQPFVSLRPRDSEIRSDGSIRPGSVVDEGIVSVPESNDPIPTDDIAISSGPILDHAIEKQEHEQYSLAHLELLHHFEHDVCQDVEQFLPRWSDVSRVSIREGFRSDYLMDILIAVAAAHKSTLPNDGDRTALRSEATRLLSRSVAKFNAEREITEDRAFAAFLFTVCLGQLVMFEMFAEGSERGGDLMAILERFVHCMKLHQGVREVVKPVWYRVGSVWSCELDEWQRNQGPMPAQEGSLDRECSPLWEMVGRSDISDSSQLVYASAIDALQSMLDRSSSAPTQRMSMVQQWLIRVPAGFLGLIGQRRPEALVILAYYGVLLYKAREFWAVGDAGRLLIRSITTYLGEYWSHYLAWPNKVSGAGTET